MPCQTYINFITLYDSHRYEDLEIIGGTINIAKNGDSIIEIIMRNNLSDLLSSIRNLVSHKLFCKIPLYSSAENIKPRVSLFIFTIFLAKIYTKRVHMVNFKFFHA